MLRAEHLGLNQRSFPCMVLYGFYIDAMLNSCDYSGC